MYRILFSISLILAFVWVQSLPLHGHLHQPTDSHLAMHDHVVVHVHSHLVDLAIETAHEHSKSIEIDLLGTAISARDLANPQVLFVAAALWLFVLTILWVCIQRTPPSALPLHFGPSPLLRPSPRAPPV
jgi:hypothetical protein